VKDAALLSFRAFGWQLGKYREGLGGTWDMGKLGWNAAQGKWTGLSHRSAYMLTLPIGVAVAGGMLNYLMTGQPPQGWRDYYMPRTGRKNPDGSDVRISLPSYMKDVIAYGRHPYLAFAHSLNPFLSALVDLWNNKDFYSVQIRTPDENVLQKIWADARYLGTQGKPFFVTGMQKMAESGRPLEHGTAAFFGFMPASRQSTMSAAESAAADIMQEMMPQGARTQTQADKSKMTADLVKDLRLGKMDEAGQLVAGLKLNKRESTPVLERVLMSPLQYQVLKMPVDKALKVVWPLATEQEKLALAPVIGRKIASALKGKTIDNETATEYLRTVWPYYLRSQQQGAGSQNTNRLQSFMNKS
jgi:hypothetical protein